MQAALIEWVMARAIKLAGVGVGVSVLIGSCVMVEHRGVKKERAKIERAAIGTDVKARKKRSAAEANPDKSLESYYRD